MAKTAQTPMMSQTPSVFNQNASQNLANAGKFTPSQATMSYANNATKTAFSTPNTQFSQPASVLNQQPTFKDKMDNLLKSQDFSKQGQKDFKLRQKQELNAQKAQNLAQNPQANNLTPEQKAEKGRNAAGWALAGIDSAVNIANAGMSYANMAKQWEMANKAWNASEEQRQIENTRYNKREQERLDARDDARSAQKAVFGNREWHDANANNEGEGNAESSQNQSNGDSNADEKTAFERE